MDSPTIPAESIEQEVSVHTPEQLGTPQVTGNYANESLNYHRLGEFLGVSVIERPQAIDKLQFLYEWGKEVTGKNDWLPILEKIKDFKRDLGFQTRGVDLTEKLWRFARLESDRRRIEREMDLLKENERNTRT